MLATFRMVPSAFLRPLSVAAGKRLLNSGRPFHAFQRFNRQRPQVRRQTTAGTPVPTAASLQPNALPIPSHSPTSIYVHLPFCAQRCAYCAFTVFVSGPPDLSEARRSSDGTTVANPTHVKYIDLLCREISSFFNLHHGRHASGGVKIKSVYFGGGTPSLIEPTLLRDVFNTLKQHVDFADDIEVTLEMDPATFNMRSAVEFANLGVTRASIGAQSFNDDILRLCNRLHTSKDIPEAVKNIRHAGIHSISMDLISGLPHDTLDGWKRSIERTLQLNAQHISIYDLTLEEGTKFFNKYEEGISPLPNENLSVDMLSYAINYLETQTDFERYEISNFAIPNHYSRHNLTYWKNLPFYAFGVGATSLVDNTRFIRPKSMKQYSQYVTDLEYAVNMKDNIDLTDDNYVHTILYKDSPVLTDVERFEDFVINSMRIMRDGIDFKLARQLFDEDMVLKLENAVEKCKHLVDDELISVLTQVDGKLERICLTNKGSFIENSIVSDLLLHSIWK